MQDDHSGMFQVDRTEEFDVKKLALFDKNTEIIKQGQRHRVVFGQMQEEKKPLHEILAPYLERFAITTAQLAAKAGTNTYEAIKNGFLWVYNKLVNTVVPYAVENLPKIIFVTKKQQNIENAEKVEEKMTSNSFQVLVSDDDYKSIEKQRQKQQKRRVVVPLGTQNDKHFQEFLKNEKYEIKNYSFPIDVDSSEQIRVKQSFMIPSESFQVIVEQVKQSHIQLQMPIQQHTKVAFKLENCFIFQFQGQNTIQYDLLDSIQKAKDTKVGFIMAPEETLHRSRSQVDIENDPIAQLVAGIQKSIQIEWKEVDMERKVRVEIQKRKPKPQYELALN